jgi:hypothetical protein
MPGFWFIQSEENSKRATNWAGSVVIAGSLLLGYVLWDSPEKAAMLLPLSVFYVGWKIRNSHARGWALLLVLVLLGLSLVGTFAPDIPDRQIFAPISWAVFALAVYGWAGACGYRRIAATNPFGLNHEDVAHQTKASISAGLGACFCLLLIPGFACFSSRFGSKEIASAVFMTVFLLAFLDPFLEYLGRTFGIKEVTFGKQKIKVQVGVVAISLLAVLLHSWIEEGVRQVGYSVPAILLMLLLVPGQITAAWIDGVEKNRSSWLGLSRGFMLGLISVWVIYIFLVSSNPQPRPFTVLRFLFNPQVSATSSDPTLSAAVLDPPANWILWAFANACDWGILGFAGGWARDRKWRARGILSTLFLTVLFEGGAAYWAATQWHLAFYADLEHLFLVQLLLVAGWGLGILLYPGTDNLLDKYRVHSSRPITSFRSTEHPLIPTRTHWAPRPGLGAD